MPFGRKNRLLDLKVAFWKVGAIQTLLHFYNVYFNIKIFWKWPKKIWGQKEGHGLTLYIQYHYLHGSYNQIKCWSLILMPGCWIHQHPQFHFSVSFFAGKPRITYNLRFEFQLPHSILETGHQNLRQLNCSFTTISSHFSGIYINVFHKTEIQTVILRCWMGLYLNLFKIYDTKGIYFSFRFFANHMVIFHKTEIQTVILRCLMSLNLNWYKSYDTKRKNSKNANLCFWTKLQKKGKENISVFCHNFWTNQNLLEFRPVKHVLMTIWTSVLWKMNIHISKNGQNWS